MKLRTSDQWKILSAFDNLLSLNIRTVKERTKNVTKIGSFTYVT